MSPNSFAHKNLKKQQSITTVSFRHTSNTNSRPLYVAGASAPPLVASLNVDVAAAATDDDDDDDDDELLLPAADDEALVKKRALC